MACVLAAATVVLEERADYVACARCESGRAGSLSHVRQVGGKSLVTLKLRVELLIEDEKVPHVSVPAG